MFVIKDSVTTQGLALKLGNVFKKKKSVFFFFFSFLAFFILFYFFPFSKYFICLILLVNCHYVE